MPDGSGSSRSEDFFEIFSRSLAIVSVAELFDKTWFMGLLLALRYKANIVFLGSFSALLLHAFLAAAFGYTFTAFLSQRVLLYMTSGLFFFFALLYLIDFYKADPEADAIAVGKEEAEIDVGFTEHQEEAEIDVGFTEHQENMLSDKVFVDEAKPKQEEWNSDNSSSSSSAEDHGSGIFSSVDLQVFGKSFMAVFIAEWGDRTQIAMISQNSSEPLLPVLAGSILAFFLLTLSAVLSATLLHGRKLRERVVLGTSAFCFALFGALALRDALACETRFSQ